MMAADRLGHRSKRRRPRVAGVGRCPQRGQATIELVAVLPLAAIVVASVAAVLAAGSASELAGAAAEAGAAAILQDGDPDAAAKRALGTDTIARARIEVRDRRVTVEVRPNGVPAPLASLLTATASAHAGPGPAADPATVVVRGGDGESSRPRDDSPGRRPAAVPADRDGAAR